MKHSEIIIFTWILSLSLAACRGNEEADADGDADGDVDVDGDIDGDGDSDGDSDGEGDEDVDCVEGLEDCAGVCVDLRLDPTHCGHCSRSCADGELCVEGECTPAVDCRTEPCPSGYFCDLSDGRCHSGCAGDDDCAAHASCESLSHQCRCDSGYHDCGGACVDSTSPEHCGSRCSPCADDDHGQATCLAGTCGLACDDGYLLCGGVCAPCPADTHGDGWGCAGTECILDTCDTGFHLCDGLCLSSSSPESCGTSCAPCPEPANSDATCLSGRCDFACRSGYHECGAECPSVTDPNFCGAGCVRCTAPEGGTARCESGACVPVCTGMTLCDGVCADLDTDERHCGGCGSPCSTGAECRDGGCVCLTSWTLGPFVDEATWYINDADVGDVDGDGDLDLVTGGDGPYASEVRLKAVLNNGDGTFDWPVDTNPDAELTYLNDVAVGNFDGDPLLDVATLLEDTTTGNVEVRIFSGDGRGAFPTWSGTVPHTSGPHPGYPFRLTAYDLEGDGDRDLIAVTESQDYFGVDGVLSVSAQGPAGTFTSRFSRSYEGLMDAAVGDLNADGRADLVLTRSGTDCLALLGNALGGYDELDTFPCTNGSGVAVGDLSDAAGDEVVLSETIGDDLSGWTLRVTVFERSAGGLTPGPVYEIPGAYWTAAPVVTDLDGDGDGDVLLLFVSGDNEFVVQAMMGGGDGTLCFHDSRVLTNMGSLVRLLSADLNHDGCMDVVVASLHLHVALGDCG